MLLGNASNLDKMTVLSDTESTLCHRFIQIEACSFRKQNICSSKYGNLSMHC